MHSNGNRRARTKGAVSHLALKGLTHFRRAAVSFDASLVVSIIRTPAPDPPAAPDPPLSPPPPSPPAPWLEKAPDASASIKAIRVDCAFDGTLFRKGDGRLHQRERDWA